VAIDSAAAAPRLTTAWSSSRALPSSAGSSAETCRGQPVEVEQVVLAVVCQAASEDEKRSLVSVHADADSSPLVGSQRAKELLDDD